MWCADIPVTSSITHCLPDSVGHISVDLVIPVVARAFPECLELRADGLSGKHNGGSGVPVVSCEEDCMRYLKDLLLTDTFLLRGHLKTGDQRLSTFLNTTPKRFLEMDEVTVVNRARGEHVLIARMLLHVEEILIAHEMEDTGDEGLKLLAEREKDEVGVTAYFGGAVPLQLSGKVSKRAIERDVSARHDFIVVVEPKLREFGGKAAHEYAVLEDLPYMIANRNRLAFIVL